MALNLSSPIGAAEDGLGVSEYTQVDIVKFTYNNNAKSITFAYQFGNTIDGVWRPAQPFGQEVKPIAVSIFNKPAVMEGEEVLVPAQPDFDNIVAAAKSTGADELAVNLAASQLYIYMKTNAGTGHLKSCLANIILA